MALSKSKPLNAKLALAGILTNEDVLFHLPRRYESYLYTEPKTIYQDGERIVMLGTVRGNVKVTRFAHRSLASFYFVTKAGHLFNVEAWNRPYLGKTLKDGDDLYSVIGVYNARRHAVELINMVKGEVLRDKALKPIYSLPEGVSNYVYTTLVNRALIALRGQMEEPIPLTFRKKYRLDSIYESLRMAHQPESYEDIHRGLRALKYQEALEFSLKTQIVREENRVISHRYRKEVNREELDRFIASLPYSLTGAQKTALQECLADMDSAALMYRLLQGDVGSGKTLVAALLCYACHTRGEQSALMAPTDALAKQHYQTFKTLFAEIPVNIGLLVGTMDNVEKRNVLADLADGTLDMVIGTHALFSKHVEYNSLGLVIIDEQHKFGVNQRMLLVGKGERADLLLMSATPIPRTLALTVYGDMDVSTLDEFPSGKRDVHTQIISPKDPSFGDYIFASLESKHRIYVVVPQIEGTEDPTTSVKKVYAWYQKRFPGQVTMLHGQLDQESKDVANAAFRSGLCPILVATSLIEVGIDVKEANLMIVYSPSFFSLSSLHQLRGRIGRDGSRADFILLSDDAEENEKLEVLCHTDDGFAIAEADLKMRGPGEIAGTKQSGLPDFSFANLIDDFKIFECARDDATYLLAHKKEEEFRDFYEKCRQAVEDIKIG